MVFNGKIAADSPRASRKREIVEEVFFTMTASKCDFPLTFCQRKTYGLESGDFLLLLSYCL